MAFLLFGETVIATSPGPFPYSSHFEDSDSVLVVDCVEIEKLQNSDENIRGITFHNSKIKFLTRATFKGPKYDEFFDIVYNEPTITNGKKLKAKLGEDIEIFSCTLICFPILN